MKKESSQREVLQDYGIEYFSRQLKNPYESTIKFFEFLNKNIHITKNDRILDACGGAGNNAFYAIEKYNLRQIDVFDTNDSYLQLGIRFSKEKNLEKKINFIKENIYDISKKTSQNNYEGIICMQTISWLDNHELALSQLKNLESSWIALSSLFYEGLIDAFIDIKTYDKSLKVKYKRPYNIYSIPKIENYLKKLGFSKIVWEKFNLSISLPQVDINEMGTFTEELKNSEKISRSGPILLPWWFVFAKV